CPYDEADRVPAFEGTPIRARTVVPSDPRVPGRLLRRAALPPRIPKPRGHHPRNSLPPFLVRARDDGGRRLVGHRGQRRKVRSGVRGGLRRRGGFRRRRGRHEGTSPDHASGASTGIPTRVRGSSGEFKRRASVRQLSRTFSRTNGRSLGEGRARIGLRTRPRSSTARSPTPSDWKVHRWRWARHAAPRGIATQTRSAASWYAIACRSASAHRWISISIAVTLVTREPTTSARRPR